MVKKKMVSLAVLIIIMIMPVMVSAGDVDGVFDKVPGQAFHYDGAQVEIMEFMSFYCGHCYNFEKAIPVILGNFPGKVRWRTIPIYWGNGSPKPGEAFLLAEEAGKGNAMRKAIFKAIFVDRRNIGDVDVLEELASGIGLGFDFSRRLRAGEKAGEIGKAILLSKQLNIDQTPTLVIAGNIKTTPDMVTGGAEALMDNTISIVKSVLAGEFTR